MKPQHEYKHIIKPSVEYLEHCGKLMLDAQDMDAFLGVPSVQRVIYSGRIPSPVRLGNIPRWTVMELLEWVEAECPKLTEWCR